MKALVQLREAVHHWDLIKEARLGLLITSVAVAWFDIISSLRPA